MNENITPKHVRRVAAAISGLMGIVEGVQNQRWVHEGRRLVDTPQWCELYSALAELKRIKESHPEAVCDDCGGPNVGWYAPNEVWNKVCRTAGEFADDPMLCPRCFIIRAKFSGLDTSWSVMPH